MPFLQHVGTLTDSEEEKPPAIFGFDCLALCATLCLGGASHVSVSTAYSGHAQSRRSRPRRPATWQLGCSLHISCAGQVHLKKGVLRLKGYLRPNKNRSWPNVAHVVKTGSATHVGHFELELPQAPPLTLKVARELSHLS